MIYIGITGHRNLKQEYLPYYKQQLYKLLQKLQQKYKDIRVYSALAQGADSLIVEVAISLDIEYIAVLPMIQDIYKQDFTNSFLKKFEYLLQNALYIKEMPHLSTINEQYESAGRYISDNSHILVALWDGVDNCLQGGTSEIIKYHISKQKYRFYLLLVSREGDLTKNMIKFVYYEKW